ncbi:hypothetical protein Q9L42_020585 (plasmid) [Methylomarinum sp. Ch1-1]|uniref:Uncharacterized protein n=1 Tax=Methylomarinum roseum TaxID=3067653 RepID=A0AAU7P095_9GAMM|nr:hypothetical protein [Methylomarinum sp. Ch1-1]MDP4523318.1 hypothetical protein [Methylomarinum sp. Ch1-1]
MTFKQLWPLSPKAKERRKWSQAEMIRIFALPDRWLAQEILRLCRQARTDQPERFDLRIMNYDIALVTNVAPEVAKRLGANKFTQNERLDVDVIRLSNQRLRDYVGNCLSNCSLRTSEDNKTRPSAWALLTREVYFGNPVMIGMDRLASPEASISTYDIAARRMLEISSVRGLDPTWRWTPEFEIASQHNRSKSIEITNDDGKDDETSFCLR